MTLRGALRVCKPWRLQDELLPMMGPGPRSEVAVMTRDNLLGDPEGGRLEPHDPKLRPP